MRRFVPRLLPLLLASASFAQEPAPGFTEDFENRLSLNVLYDGWEQVRSSQYPAYNDISLVDDPDTAFSGKHCIRFRTQGRATAFQMLPYAAAKIDPKGSYLFKVQARMEGTLENEAFVALQWRDAESKILRVDRTSALTRAAGWTELVREIRRVPAQTASVTFGLHFEGGDLRGECLFDALSLSAFPRIDVLPADRTLFLYEESPVEPRLTVTLAGLPDGTHHVEISTVTLEGEPVGNPIDLPVQTGQPGAVRLPALRPGAYQMHLSLAGPAGPAAKRTIPLLVANPWVSDAPSGRLFGASLNPFETDYPDAVGLLRLAGCRNLKFTVWDSPLSPSRPAPGAKHLFDMLLALGEEDLQSLTGVLARPPRELFPKAEAFLTERGVLHLFERETSLWEQPLRETVREFRELIREWQIGSDADAALVARRGADRTLGTVAGILRELSPRARLGVPARAEDLAGLDLKSVSFYSVPMGEKETGRPIDERGKRCDLSASLPARDGNESAEAVRAQAGALLRRLIRTAATSSSTAYIPLDSSPDEGVIDGEGNPFATLLALRAANDALSGAKPRPDLDLYDPPLHGTVFEREGRGILALWTDEGESAFHIPAGPDAEIYPPLGERWKQPAGKPLRVGPMPLFVLNADLFLLELQRSVHFLDPRPEKPDPQDSLPLRADASLRALHFRNPHGAGMQNLRIGVQVPAEAAWTIRPASRFPPENVAAPGAEFSREFWFTLPYSEDEPSRAVQVTLSFARNGRDYELRMIRPIRLVPQILIDVAVAGRPDARKVTVRLKNAAARTMSLIARIRLPNLPEQSEPLGRLEGEPPETREFTYVVKDMHLVDPERLHVEVLCEERGGDRVFAHKVFPIR